MVSLMKPHKMMQPSLKVMGDCCQSGTSIWDIYRSMFQMQQGQALIAWWGMWNVWPWNFKHLLGTCKDQQGQTGPQNERPIQDHGDKGDSLRATPLELNKRKEIKVGGKEEVWAHKAFVKPMPSPFPETVQTHLPQISLQGRNMMLCDLNCWMGIYWHRSLAWKL